MTWADYEQLVSEDYSGYRVSYWQGNITIVSPSRNHERIAETINGLVKTYCRKHDLVYFPIGSTTLKNPPLAGKEPDYSFAFHTDKSIPDLAVEVTYSSGGAVDLEKYQYLGVKEVWFWQNSEITFYGLADSGYGEISQSFCLPQLSADCLLTFVNRGLTESPLTIEADFYQAV
ncbi:MAG: Uma2 family endonuclease [Cyanobacteria bacterium P01_H01_bin.162]